MARTPGFGTEYRQLLYLGRFGQSLWAGYLANADWFSGGHGGVLFIPLGAIVVGLIIKWFDWLYEQGKAESNRYKAAILQSFCFGAVFNIIVLAREGLDSFVSRVVFFCVIFGACLVLAKLLYWLFDTAGLIKRQGIKSNRLSTPNAGNQL